MKINTATALNGIAVPLTWAPETSGVYIFESTDDEDAKYLDTAGYQYDGTNYKLYTGYYYDSEADAYYKLKTYQSGTLTANTLTYKAVNIDTTPYVVGLSISNGTISLTDDAKVIASAKGEVTLSDKYDSADSSSDQLYFDYSTTDNNQILVKYHIADSSDEDEVVFTIAMGEDWNENSDDGTTPGWQKVTDSDGVTAFYTKNDLDPDASTKELISTVTLTSSNFTDVDFDLNVILKSIQVVSDNGTELIPGSGKLANDFTTTAEIEAFEDITDPDHSNVYAKATNAASGTGGKTDHSEITGVEWKLEAFS